MQQEQKKTQEDKHTQLSEVKWDEFARTLDSENWRSNYLRQAQRHLVSIMDVKEGMHVLDIGCGTGYALGQIAMRVNGHGEFHGVDLSTEMVEKAKENFTGQDNFHFVKANSESIPLSDDYFDAILCTNSFHHYLNPVQALKEMRRLINAGGRIYILDPSADSWFIKVIDRIIRIFEPTHVKLYSTKEFQKLYFEAGLVYVYTEIISWNQKIHVGRKT